MMKHLILGILFLLQGGFPTMIETCLPVTLETRADPPAIVEIRRLYQAIEGDLSKGKLKKQYRKVEQCGPFGDERTLFLDRQGTVRKYVWEGGSDDSALVIRHYYDEAGNLRFVFITGGAVNGSQLEHRIYLDSKGTRVRELHAYTKGPGYTFPSVWPDKDLARNPKQAFAEQCTG